MRIEVVTLFPDFVRAAIEVGVLGRAVRQGIVAVGAHDPRDFARDPHRTVDDRPYGGGPGMVMCVEPTRSALRAATAAAPVESRRIYLGAEGERLGHRKLAELATLPGLVLLAGRYEGVDERLLESEVDERISIGDYVLSGGELAALVMIDGIVRLLPGALGDADSAREDSFFAGLLDWPHYTRPESLGGRSVPDVLMGGNHAAIERWRRKEALRRTYRHRPDLLRRACLNAEQRSLLDEAIADEPRCERSP